MWNPLQREHLVLETGLPPEECARRIARTAGTGGRAFWFPTLRPVLGFVRGGRFSVARHPVLQIPLETWISGRIGAGPAERLDPPPPRATTRIEIAIGPNPSAGVALTVIASLLLAAALALTKLAVQGVPGAAHGLFLSWIVVLGFVIAFFVVPAVDHSEDRAFLLQYLCSTLRAAVVADPRGRRA